MRRDKARRIVMHHPSRRLRGWGQVMIRRLRHLPLSLYVVAWVTSGAAPPPLHDLTLSAAGSATVIEGHVARDAMQRYQFTLDQPREIRIHLACKKGDVSFQLVSPARLPIYDSRYGVEGRDFDMLLTNKERYEIDVMPGLNGLRDHDMAAPFTLSVTAD
ncbi:hypothetical protein N5W20_00435 [Candidatus Kirkpatrickella diaphorinae]|uniref:Uncharacterized protein n=1 Tax=Candidatus Kirkpatrickella diaphorinae TaxID=2984322 RepID=A0ABY6GJ98_9PROT|nr:hypothetical protein [Candidatus Kirkpatrickella diaphorinae]UYH51387.1 hypothetical protein N5W20_00435 [Candidatus Kirkpatrickella diaphorinae]